VAPDEGLEGVGVAVPGRFEQEPVRGRRPGAGGSDEGRAADATRSQPCCGIA